MLKNPRFSQVSAEVFSSVTHLTHPFVGAHTMRGFDVHQADMYSSLSPEERVPQDHPLRPIREMVDRALAALSRDFDQLYARSGRPSVPPQQLLLALLLQIFYPI